MVIWQNTKDSCLNGLCCFVAMPVTKLMPTLLQQRGKCATGLWHG